MDTLWFCLACFCNLRYCFNFNSTVIDSHEESMQNEVFFITHHKPNCSMHATTNTRYINVILKRSRDFLLYTKKETSSGLSQRLNNSCYFYLPRIFYERKYSITWLQWNTTSRGVNIVVKLTNFRIDPLRSIKTHIVIVATMNTGTICNIRGSYDDWRVIGTHFDGLVFRTFLSENCYSLFLTLVQ